MHGVEHATHLGQCVGDQQRARGTKGVAQARGSGIQRLGEVDAGIHN